VREIAPHNFKIMEAMKIQTPTKEIMKNMLNDEWINIDAIINHNVKLELILMYQHGVVPLMEPAIYYDKSKFLNATIDGQIKANEIALEKCKFGDNWRDLFFEGLGMMHKTQLSILYNLRNLMITQFN